MNRALLTACLGLVTAVACTNNGPEYDLAMKLPLTQVDGGFMETRLTEGTSNLTLFPCDVSIRLGQCRDARPVQLVIVPGGADRSGTTDCGQDSARALLTKAVGSTLNLSQGADGGAGVWIQAFHGDDDDGSGLVDRPEMAAYAEFIQGTLTVNSFDGQQLEGVVDAKDPDRGGTLSGTVGAVDGDTSGTAGVGPRCTWPIGAKAN